jgi:aspartate aminotransferase-like enzyme
MADFRVTKRLLCALTKSSQVEILLGSGSLANDAVCAQLSLLNEPGLILSNGEFGERLIDHARRQQLEYEVCQIGWGEPFDYAEIRRRLERNPRLRWVWAVHCETSTGILNEVETLTTLCAACGVKLALDCISSIGTVAVDLSGVYLASCVSGKALASYPGLSMVFYNHNMAPAPQDLPRYLDLGYYAEQAGVPFTHSSNLIYALQTALNRIDWPAKFQQIAEIGVWLREQLRQVGLEIVAPDAHAASAVVTIALPPQVSSGEVGRLLRSKGYLLSYNSGYLRQRNWIQICLMGEWCKDTLHRVPEVIASVCREERARQEEALMPA